MKTRAFMMLAVTFAVAAAGGGAASAGADDDQAAADAAIAAFNEDMLGLGARSNGPQDTTEVSPEEIAAESPEFECLGDFGTGLDARGRLEGETARAFSDEFTLPAANEVPSTDPAYYPGGENVSAAIITLGEDHQDTLDQLIGSAGSDEVAQCIEDAFQAFADAESASAGTTGGSVPPSFEIDVTVNPDLGIGDASAQFTLGLTTTFQDVVYGYSASVYVARADRSLAILNVNSESEDTSIIDPIEVLDALVESL